MATATSEPVSKRTVVLRLDEDEAETLLNITWKIGGDPISSRRGHTEAISQALRSVGVQNPRDGDGSIKFEKGFNRRAPFSDEDSF